MGLTGDFTVSVPLAVARAGVLAVRFAGLLSALLEDFFLGDVFISDEISAEGSGEDPASGLVEFGGAIVTAGVYRTWFW